MWVRGGHQFVLFPKGDKELSWHFQALLPTFVFFLLSQQQIVSLFSVLAEFYCTNYWDLFFSVSKSFKSQVLVNSIDTFLTFQFQEVEKSCQWISHREKSLEKLEKKSQKRGLLYYQKKRLFTPRFLPFGFRLASAHFEAVRKSIADFSRWPPVDTFMLGAKFDSSQQSRLRFYLSSSQRKCLI